MTQHTEPSPVFPVLRKVAGKVVLKTTKGIVKNVFKNIASDLAMTTVITGGTTLFTQGVERFAQ